MAVCRELIVARIIPSLTVLESVYLPATYSLENLTCCVETEHRRAAMEHRWADNGQNDCTFSRILERAMARVSRRRQLVWRDSSSTPFAKARA